MLIAADGENSRKLIDLIDVPFYGGRKYLLREKILSPDTKLASGKPLVSAPLNALFEAEFIEDIVIVCNPDQAEQFERIAEEIPRQKPYSIVPSEGDIGNIIALGSGLVRIHGPTFYLLPDLPYVDGSAIDYAIMDILHRKSGPCAGYIPVVSKEFFQNHNSGWKRPFFPQLARTDEAKSRRLDRFKALDFVIADSDNINPQFVSDFYSIRMLRSLKGKLNAAYAFHSLVPRILMKYFLSELSLPQLEDIASSLNGNQVRIVEVTNPIYASFMKDIDTRQDYETYLKNNKIQG